MHKENLSPKQGICFVILFILGTASIISRGIEGKKDLWLSIILALLMAIPLVWIYARLHSIFLSRDLFDIVEICFGKCIGKIIGIMYIWYGIQVASLIAWNLVEFILLTTLKSTPRIVIIGLVILISIWLVKEGIEVMGRFIEIFLPTIVVLIGMMILFLIPKMNINNITPVLQDGMKPIMEGAFSALTFPFGEVVILSMIFSTFNHKKSSYKVYIVGTLIGAILIWLISITNILVLGVEDVTTEYFPSYLAVSRIKIGNFIGRIEIIAGTIFIVGAFIKFSICLFAASKGIAKIFNCKKYRFVVTPVALLIVNIYSISFQSITELIEWNKKVAIYNAILYQVILPLFILLVAQIKQGNKKKG